MSNLEGHMSAFIYLRWKDGLNFDFFLMFLSSFDSKSTFCLERVPFTTEPTRFRGGSSSSPASFMSTSLMMCRSGFSSSSESEEIARFLRFSILAISSFFCLSSISVSSMLFIVISESFKSDIFCLKFYLIWEEVPLFLILFSRSLMRDCRFWISSFIPLLFWELLSATLSFYFFEFILSRSCLSLELVLWLPYPIDELSSLASSKYKSWFCLKLR